MNEKEIIWRSDIKNWEKLSKDVCDLLLSLAKKRLKETVSISDFISNKNNLILGINTTIITSLVGLIVIYNSNMLIFGASILGLVICSYAQYYLLRNLFPFTIGTLGEEPRLLMTSDFLESNDLNDQEQYNALVIQVCEAYQTKIILNMQVNSKRNIRISLAVISLSCFPLCFLPYFFERLFLLW